MSRARRLKLIGLLAAPVLTLVLPQAAQAAAPGPAAPPLPLPPCTVFLTTNCVPPPGSGQTLPTPQLFQPAPSPSPTPTYAPGPTPAPAPAPLPGAVPTDFGIGAMTRWVYGGGSWLAPQVYSLLIQSTGPVDWFGPLYQHMVDIGFLLLLLFMVLGLCTAIIRRDFWLLVKVPCLYAPLAIGVTVLAVNLTQRLEAITDGFTIYMLQAGLGDHLQAFLVRVAAVLAAGAAGVLLLGPESFIVFLAAVTVAGGLLLLLLELIARQVAIYACLLFVPATIVAIVWPPLVRLPKLLLEVLIGLVVLKWIVAAVLALGFAMLDASPLSTGPQGDRGFETIVMGAVVLLAAVLGGPIFLAKAIPFAEHQAAAHWTQPPRRAAAMVGLTNTRHLHEAALARFGRRETRDRLAAARRQHLVLPEGARIFIRTPQPAPARTGAPTPRGSRRTRSPRRS